MALLITNHLNGLGLGVRLVVLDGRVTAVFPSSNSSRQTENILVTHLLETVRCNNRPVSSGTV